MIYFLYFRYPTISITTTGTITTTTTTTTNTTLLLALLPLCIVKMYYLKLEYMSVKILFTIRS